MVTTRSALELVTALRSGFGVVAEPAYGDDLGAERAQPGRQHRAEGVPDESVVGQALGQQLVAEDEDLDAAAGARVEQLVVPGGRGEAEHGRGHQGAGGQQLVAGAALLAARADVLAGADVARSA